MPDASLYRSLAYVAAALCLGIALVAGLTGAVAQDALSYVAAADLAAQGQWDAVYPSMDDVPRMDGAFTRRYCELAKTGPDLCKEFAVPFLSPPPKLLLTRWLSTLGSPLALLAFQVLSALAVATGMILLWHQVRSLQPVLARPLAVGLLLLLPLAQVGIEKGQTSTWLFTALVLGLVGSGSRRTSWGMQGGLGVLVALCAISKLTPVLLVPVLLVCGHGRAGLVAIGGIAGLTTLAHVWYPVALWSDFLTFNAEFRHWVPEYVNNTSPEAAWYRATELILGEAAWVEAFSVVKLVGLGLLALAGLVRLRGARLWAFAWLVWLVASPLNWAHYNFVLVGATAYLLAPAVRTELQGWLLVAWLLGAVVVSLLLGSPLGPLVGGPWLLATVVLVAGVVLRRERD